MRTVGALIVAGVMMAGGAAAAEEAVCLSQPMKFADKEVKGCLSAGEAAELLDRPVILGGDENGRGLELTHPINIREKKEVKTCREYRAAHGEEWFAMTTYDMTIEGHFVKRCGLLDRVVAATPARVNHLPKKPVTQADLSDISVSVLALFDPEGSSGLAGAAEAGRTLKDFADDGALEVTEQNAVRLDMSFGAMAGTLQELARGDFTGDGIQDALVTCGVRAKEGSYRATDLMVVTKLSADGPLEAVNRGGGI